MSAPSAETPTVLRSIRRRWLVVAVCCILVPGSAFALSKSQEKQYSASASLLFRDAGFDQRLFGSQSVQRATDPAREAATNVKLVSLDTVAERTAKQLPGAGAISEKVQVSAEGQSDVVSITATDRSPVAAAQIANVFAQEYIAFRRKADRAKIADARELVNNRLQGLGPGERQGSLRERLEQLDILASLQTGNAELAEAAEPPTSASSPRVVRNTVLGGILGILLGVGLALLFERLDRRLRDPKDLEDIFERPILGAIPDSKVLSGDGHAPLGPVGAREGESFRMMRANLRYFNIDQRTKSVLITSAAPGDGKTTVAWNLAAVAGVGSKVLLMEADLRHPGIATGLALRDVAGLSTVLAGEADLGDVVQKVAVEESQNGSNPRTLDVLTAGPLPPNPTDLLESDRMREVIANAERLYELVVIDTPPTSIVPDAIPLVTQVGGVIAVGRLGKTTREAALHLCRQLRNLDAPVLGVVANSVESGADPYGYAYGYGADYGGRAGLLARLSPRRQERERSTGPANTTEPPGEKAVGKEGTSDEGTDKKREVGKATARNESPAGGKSKAEKRRAGRPQA